MSNDWSVCVMREGVSYVVEMHGADVVVVQNNKIVYKEDLRVENCRLSENTKRMLAETVIGVYEQQREAEKGMQYLLKQERFKGWAIMN